MVGRGLHSAINLLRSINLFAAEEAFLTMVIFESMTRLSCAIVASDKGAFKELISKKNEHVNRNL